MSGAMRRRISYHTRISPAAILVCALAVYFIDAYVLSALMLAVAVHELGHVLCLRAFRQKIYGFSIDAGGLCIAYRSECAPLVHALSAAAGPATGIICAYACSYIGTRFNIDWLCLGAGIGLVLSLYNLLPVLPLDGGRIFAVAASALLGERTGNALSTAVGVIICALLLALGVRLFVRSCGAGVMLAAICLIFAALKEQTRRGY